jgi:hypothetical protein
MYNLLFKQHKAISVVQSSSRTLKLEGKAKEKESARYEVRICFMADVSEKYQSQIHKPTYHLEIFVAYVINVFAETVVAKL